MVTVTPTLHHPASAPLGVLRWVWPREVEVLGSAPVGGGRRRVSWLLNVGVELDYARVDLEVHAAEVATDLGLVGDGAVLFTAADVERFRTECCDGAAVDATVGITKPTWAADALGGFTPWRPGTINVVAQLPVGLSEAAAVNAVITLTEAKTQALLEAGVPGTGTASDAAVVVWPSGAAVEEFAGPRSTWGARLAIATHAAVAAGAGDRPTRQEEA